MSTLTSEESFASLDFAPDTNPFETGPRTLHGLSHPDVSAITEPGSEAGAVTGLRYVMVRGSSGSLSGYVKTEQFDAICQALGVRS